MKLLKRLLPIVLVAAFVSTAKADTKKVLTLQFETLITEKDSFQPAFSVFHGIEATDGALGGFIFALVTESYAQAYTGPSLTFPLGKEGFLQAGFGIGIEQSSAPDDRNPLRLGSYVYIEANQHIIALIAEIGATNKKFAEPFYYGRYAYRANEFFDFGVMARRFSGIGPRIDFWLHNPGLGVWAAPLYDPETEAWGGMLTFMTGY